MQPDTCERRGTKQDVPTILIVDPDAETLDDDRAQIVASGAEAIGCLGPDRAMGCPLLYDGVCARFERADGIILQLDLDNEDHRTVLAQYVALTEVPMKVIASRDEATRWAFFLKHLDVEVDVPTSEVAASLVRELRR